MTKCWSQRLVSEECENLATAVIHLRDATDEEWKLLEWWRRWNQTEMMVWAEEEFGIDLADDDQIQDVACRAAGENNQQADLSICKLCDHGGILSMYMTNFVSENTLVDM